METPKYDMMKDEKEFSKRKASMGPEYEDVPREQPSQQKTGGQGYEFPEYYNWTNEELRKAAEKLELPEAATAGLAQLIEILTSNRKK